LQGESDEDVTVWLTETEKWIGFGALDGTDTETSAGGEQSRAGSTADSTTSASAAPTSDRK